MTKLRAMVSWILLAVVLGGPVAASVSAVPGRHGSGSSGSHKATSRPKTVHVRSYTKKNGTVVRANYRAAPQPRQMPSAPAERSKLSVFFSHHPRLTTRDQRSEPINADAVTEYNSTWPERVYEPAKPRPAAVVSEMPTYEPRAETTGLRVVPQISSASMEGPQVGTPRTAIDLGLFLNEDSDRIDPRFIAKGTGLKILSRGSMQCRVELIDGPYKGHTARIYENAIDFGEANDILCEGGKSPR